MGTFLADRVDELRRDSAHGAGWMAERAVEALVEQAEARAADADELLNRLHEAGMRLAASRPAAGAVAGALGRVLAAAFRHRHLSAEELRHLVGEETRALVDGRRRAARAIAIQLSPRLAEAKVFTHSASATAREALLHTPPARVICTVSSPGEEGRGFAEELREAGLEVMLLDDDEAPAAVKSADLLLVGADTVFRDGTLGNKIGTRRLAEAAAAARVPTIVACEVLKLAPFASVEPKEGTRDLTPPNLIGELVTEEGTFQPDEIGALIDRTPFLREGYELLRVGPTKSPGA